MTISIHTEQQGVLYENPLPQLKSRQAHFPNVVQLKDGTLLAAFMLGEALESVDSTTVISKSTDNGNTWNLQGPIYDKQAEQNPTSDCMKLTVVDEQKLVAFGYRFDRSDETLPLGNPKTGGLLEDELILFESVDGGSTWGKKQIIPTAFKDSVEASAPITVLSNGQWITPIANFLQWDGSVKEDSCGRLLRSNDAGRTWNSDTITMRLSGRKTCIWEQRACEMEPGEVLVIAWVENLETGEHLPNHVAISDDHGLHFSKPICTDVKGQASNVMYLGDRKVLALHCMRRGVEKQGILASVVDVSNNEWNVLYETMVWEPRPYNSDGKIHDAFAYMKFGQPGAIRLQDGSRYMFFWYEEHGQAKIYWQRLKVRV